MATDQTPPGAARIVKTKRLQYVVQSADVIALRVDVDVPWDTPFTDLNYTADQNVEVIAPAVADNYAVNGFTRDVNKVTVAVLIGGTAAAGDVIVVHSHAIHD